MNHLPMDPLLTTNGVGIREVEPGSAPCHRIAQGPPLNLVAPGTSSCGFEVAAFGWIVGDYRGGAERTGASAFSE